MKETSFVKNNKGKWERFERLFGQKNNDPDEISELFTEITEDLSYARTFYPRRSVRVYLNQIAQGVFTSLYKQKKQPIRGFAKFWKETIPLALYDSRKNILMALVFFLGAAILGAVSQHYDHSFVELILGEGYVSDTEQRIADGNPMGIYGESSGTSMFFMITINNIKVAFYAFVSGIFFGLITYLIMLQNGIMLGAFQWWFKTKGLLLTSFLAIWIHGAFEISAIVIAGGAGITLGNGLLFPKSHSRIQSLIFSGKKGMLILMSLVPVFIMAGTLESFVTRYYQSMPLVLNWFIIIGSFAIIIMYYGIYPFIVAKQHPDRLKLIESPRYIPKRKITLQSIRSTGELFTDTTYRFIEKAKLLTGHSFKIIITGGILLLLAIVYMDQDELNYSLYWYETFEIIFGWDGSFHPLKLFGWSLLLTLAYQIAYFVANHKTEPKTLKQFFKTAFKSFLWLYLFFTVIVLIFLFFNWGLLLLFLLFLGFVVMLTPVIISEEQTNVFTAIGKSFKLINNSYGQALGNSASFSLITIIFFFILHNPTETSALTLLDEILNNILVGNTFYNDTLINAFNGIIYLFFITFIVTLTYTNAYYFYHSLYEKQNATNLKSQIESIGKRSKTFETNLEFE